MARTRVSPSKSTGRRRMMRLGDYVEEKSKDREWCQYFKMNNWFGSVDTTMAEDLELKRGDVVPVNGGCGTAACMLGHLPNIPMFQRLGVSTRLKNMPYPDGSTGQVLFVFDKKAIPPIVLGKKLFGISEDRFCDIFTGKGYSVWLGLVTPAMAVRKLREVVAEIDQNEGWKF